MCPIVLEEMLTCFGDAYRHMVSQPQTLIRLTDAGQNNTSFWCRHCQVEWHPESENLRKESKLVVPDRNIEPAVSTTPGIGAESVAIRHEPEIKGGLKALKDRSLKITHYKEHIPK